MDSYTLVRVILSLIGIVSGLIVLAGLLRSNRMDGWTLLFLLTTILTSVTGFGFPFHGVTPAIIVGIISLFVLGLAVLARYAFGLSGAWRWIYVVSAVLALYFDCFVWWCKVSSIYRRCIASLLPDRNDPLRSCKGSCWSFSC